MVKLSNIVKEIQAEPLPMDGDKFTINGSIYNIGFIENDYINDFILDIAPGDENEIEEFDILHHLEDKDEYYSIYFQKDYDKFMAGDEAYKTLTMLTPVGVKQAIAVLATVGNYMIKNFKNKHNYVLHFSADTSEPSRVKLYDRLVKILQSRLSLKLYVGTTSEQRHYFLYD